MSVVGQAFVEILPVSTGFGSALQRQIKDASDKAAKNSSGLLGSVANVGKAASLLLVGAAVAAGAASVKMASDFQSASVHLVTDAGEAASNLKMVQDGMLRISQQTGTSAMDIVNGMYHIESAGYHGAAGLELLRVAAEGAKVGGADLDTVSKTLTGTMRSYNIPAGQAVNVMNELIAAVGHGDMRMQDLASSLGNVTPIAAAAGISLAQVTGAIATMTAQNMSAQQATQDVANTIRSLQAPGVSATDMMAQFGLNANDVSRNLGKVGLTGTLNELTQAILTKMGPSGLVMLNAFHQSMGAAQDMQVEISKMPPSIATMAKSFMDGQMTMGQWRSEAKKLPADQRLMMQGFMQTYSTAHRFNSLLRDGSPAAMTYNSALEKMLGGATGLNTALMLTGSNMATFTGNVNDIAAAASKGGKNVDNWGMIQKTFAQQMSTFKVTVEDLAIKIGLKLIPVVETVMHAFERATFFLMQHKQVALALASVVGGALTVAIAAFTAVALDHMFSKVKDGIKIFKDLGAKSIETIGNIGKFMLANPWIAAIALLAVAAFLIITHWKQVSKFFEGLWHDVAGFFTSLWKDIQRDFLDPIVGAFKTAIGGIVHAFDAIKAFFLKWWPVLLPIVMTLFLGPLGLVVGVIVDEIILHWHTLLHITEVVFGAIGTAVSAVWHFIDSIVRAVLGALMPYITAAWDVIAAYTRLVWDILKAYFTIWWDVLSTAFRVGLSIIEGVLSVAWDTIKAIVVTVWDGIKTYFMVWWDVLKAIVDTAWRLIVTIFTVALDLITGKWGAAWKAIKDFFSSTWNTIKSTVVSVWDDISGFFSSALGTFESWWSGAWNAVSSAVSGVWDGIRKGAQSLWSDVSGFFSTGISDVERIINSAFIGPLNAVLGIFGVHISPLGGGGGGGKAPPATGGLSSIGALPAGVKAQAESGMIVNSPTVLVGEGRKGYPEVVIPTDPAFHGRAKGLLGWAATRLGVPIPGLKHGGIWGWIESNIISPAVDPAIDAAASVGEGLVSRIPPPIVGNTAKGAIKYIAEAIKKWIGGGTGGKGTGVLGMAGALSTAALPFGQHQSLIKAALGLAGVGDSVGNESAVNIIVTHESGWNPLATNLTDINAKNGDPSRGLMQTIMTTFERYRLGSLPDNIFDPMANLVAGIRYATSRYGSLGAVPGVRAVNGGGSYVGYDSGGLLMPGFTPVWNGTGRPEVVAPPGVGRAGGIVIQPGAVHVEVAISGNTATSADVVTLVKQTVERGVTEALTDVLSIVDSHNLTGVRTGG